MTASGQTQVIADLSRCQGYANCIISNPDRFDLDTNGKVKILRADIAPAELADAEEATKSCPASALRIEMVGP